MTSADAKEPGDAPQSRPLTIAQLAKRAGVSVATVSKVVNGRAEVAAETRQTVEELIRRHGYRRQKRASGPAPMLEIVIHELAGPYPVEIVRGAGRVATEHGLAVAVTQLEGHHTPGRSWIEGILARRPTGVIAVFTSLTEAQETQLRSRDIPLVMLDPLTEPAAAAPRVGASNWNGGLTATRHLLDLGHRRIAIIAGPPTALASRARLDGYRAALDMAGTPVDESLIRTGYFRVEDGFVYTRELLALPEPPTAIFACNDGSALGVYQAAAEAGLRIPDDLSVIGFDDFFPSPHLTPSLTTIRQPLADMAASAATLALDLAQGATPAQHHIEHTTRLIIRDSTAAPRSGGSAA